MMMMMMMWMRAPVCRWLRDNLVTNGVDDGCTLLTTTVDMLGNDTLLIVSINQRVSIWRCGLAITYNDQCPIRYRWSNPPIESPYHLHHPL